MDLGGAWFSPFLCVVMCVDLIADSIKLLIFVSCVPLVAIGLVGFLFSFVQSSLQIQDQTVGHLVRLFTFGVCAYLVADLCCGMCVRFAEDIFNLLPYLGRRI
jgi:type III secretory pathway component EscS